MTKDDLLTLLKPNLDIVFLDDAKTNYLQFLIESAIQFIAREGVKLSEPFSVEDGNLIVMYAAYLDRKRATDEPMPRSLRWALNNRIFGRKSDGT